MVSYLGVFGVLIEAPLGLFLILSNSKGLLSMAAILVLVVFTAYLGYVYGFMERSANAGEVFVVFAGEERFVAERFGTSSADDLVSNCKLKINKKQEERCFPFFIRERWFRIFRFSFLIMN